MVKSIASRSWLMAASRLVSTCPSCAPRLASCPRSPSCLTAASERTSSTATTCGKSPWMRSSPPPRKRSSTTLSCHFLRYWGHFVCNVCGRGSKAEQVEITLFMFRKLAGNSQGKQSKKGAGKHRQRLWREQRHNKWYDKWQWERGWYIYTPGLTRDRSGSISEWGVGVHVYVCPFIPLGATKCSSQ